jgi:hypothetical protein
MSSSLQKVKKGQVRVFESWSPSLQACKMKLKGASKLALTVKASLDAPYMALALPNYFLKLQKVWTPT